MKRIFHFLLLISLVTAGTSCKKSDPPLPDNTVNFEAAKQGFEATATEAVIKINLSMASTVAIPLTINLTGTGLVYGTEYTTDPVATNNTLSLTIPAGGSGVSFKVKKVANAVINGTETLDFTITSAGSPIVMGSTTKSQLTFSSITSEGSQLTLKGIAGTEDGSGALNSVYVDLSSNSMVNVNRKSWVLGFSAGNDFRVRLNNTNGTSAIKLNGKVDLNAVSETDVILNDLFITTGVTGAKSFANIDNVKGDITKDIISNVSATDAENMVYVVNPAGGVRGLDVSADNLLKIRVLRKGSGYVLQYAKLKDKTFKTLDITKDPANNFTFVAFPADAQVVNVEPAKTKWDFVWTWSIYYGKDLNKPEDETLTYPYAYSDVVFMNNLGGAQAAEVFTSKVTFANFKESDIAGTSLKAERNVIGSEWRSTMPATGARPDRFYVIKDASGNVYKLRFISMGSGDGGKRGEPVIEYALVKKG
ncbi:HmuY family protein [Pedobacter caeni]|uniref:HmuY protein n=1 Tax=Pedobacter caeni TaxID=288992 RepID=A0A1M4YZG4_9SPHI|nr:HmuY family protein [Pedobacter caeni]SHF11191.1 HmuY protein [Pedobacter caeni]